MTEIQLQATCVDVLGYVLVWLCYTVYIVIHTTNTPSPDGAISHYLLASLINLLHS